MTVTLVLALLAASPPCLRVSPVGPAAAATEIGHGFAAAQSEVQPRIVGLSADDQVIALVTGRELVIFDLRGGREARWFPRVDERKVHVTADGHVFFLRDSGELVVADGAKEPRPIATGVDWFRVQGQAIVWQKPSGEATVNFAARVAAPEKSLQLVAQPFFDAAARIAGARDCAFWRSNGISGCGPLDVIDLATLRAVRLAGPVALPPLTEGGAEPLAGALSPDGRMAVFCSEHGLTLARTDGSQRFPLDGAICAEGSAAFSPDSGHLAWVRAADVTVMLSSVRDGSSKELARIPGENVMGWPPGLAFAGDWLRFWNDTGPDSVGTHWVMRWNAAGRAAPRPLGGRLCAWRPDPSGKRAAALVDFSNSAAQCDGYFKDHVSVEAIAGGAARELATGEQPRDVAWGPGGLVIQRRSGYSVLRNDGRCLVLDGAPPPADALVDADAPMPPWVGDRLVYPLLAATGDGVRTDLASLDASGRAKLLASDVLAFRGGARRVYFIDRAGTLRFATP